MTAPTTCAPPLGSSSDTSPEAERFQIEGYRRMSAADKLRIVRQLNLSVQAMALLRLRETYPGADERALRLHLASLWLPAATMRAVFDWDPDREGL